MLRGCDEQQTAGKNYTAVIEKTGLPFERNLRILTEMGNEIYWKGLMPRVEEIAKGTDGIREIQVSDDGLILLIKLKQAPFVDEIVLADFLKALKSEYPMNRIAVKCEVCHRIEQRLNHRDIIEEFTVDLETFEVEPVEK